MAIADLRLTTSRYNVPGTYIDFVPQPQAGTPQGTPRYPCIVGRGHRLARETSIPHIRARVYGEQLAFSTTAPYVAALDHNAAPDQTLAQLYSASGQPVDADKWRFIVDVATGTLYNRVQIDATSYDHTATYYIEYQSIDRDVQDDLQFNDLREMLLVGDSGGQNQYVEYEDYRVVTGLTGSATDPDALTPGTANTHLTGTFSPLVKTGAVGTGLVTFSAGNSYTGAYNRRYRITVTDGVGNLFKLETTNLSGGNAQVPNVPANVAADSIFLIAGGAAVGVQLTDPALYTVVPSALPNYVVDDGIRLTFDLNGGAFGTNDYYEWTAYAPGKIEFCSAHDNDNQYSVVNDPVELGNFNPVPAGPGTTSHKSGGVITVHSDTDYVGDFDRSYFLQCTAQGGGPAPAARTATIYWNGYGELPYTNSGAVVVTEGGNASKVLLENGVYLTFNFGTAHATIDTTNTILTPDATTLSSAITLANMIKTQFNAHDNDPGPVWHFAGPSAHQITALACTDLATLRTLVLDIQTKYAAHLADLTQHVLADTIWSLDSDLTVTATSTLAAILAQINDIKAKYNRHRQANGFAGTVPQSDTWRVDAKAARRNFTGKDDRNVTVTVNTFVAATTFPISYTSSTLEGGWGTVTVTDYSDPWVDMPDSIRLMIRNLADIESYTANNTFTFSTVNYDVVDWTLVSRSSETIAEDDIVLDTLGNVTGTPLDYYLDLQYTPEQVLRVKRADTGVAISYTWITGTPYIAFTTDPATDVIVDYEHRGDEPDPGMSYYVSANRLRALTEYDTPIRFLSPDESRAALYPATTDNHLWMASEIMWNAAPFGIYVVQVRDLSGDGNFVAADYKRAIDATEVTSEISDVTVLSPAGSWGLVTAYAKNSCEKMNSPFEAKERLLWCGAPVGTAIGDESTVDTLVYYARRSLQCPPSGKAKGNIILLGNTTATRSFQLEDGSSTTVTLDGSFIAAHTAALVASFPNPTDTILHRACIAFDTIDTPNEKEALLLGTASITWLEALGTGTYRYAESVTVDTTEKALNEISARTQAHFVVRYIRNRMNDAMIALVPPSPLAGVALLAGYLTQLLSALVSAQIIAPYGSEMNPPVVRDVSSEDYRVLVDETDRSLYHFKFFFNGRYPIKRLFGLYSIDTKFWAASAA